MTNKEFPFLPFAISQAYLTRLIFTKLASLKLTQSNRYWSRLIFLCPKLIKEMLYSLDVDEWIWSNKFWRMNEARSASILWWRYEKSFNITSHWKKEIRTTRGIRKVKLIRSSTGSKWWTIARYTCCWISRILLMCPRRRSMRIVRECSCEEGYLWGFGEAGIVVEIVWLDPPFDQLVHRTTKCKQ